DVITQTSNTIPYKPDIISIDIKNEFEETPDIIYAEGTDLVNTLTTQNNRLYVSDDPYNAFKDLYIDVTFQLDHNEDFKSIKYILLSTSFAHRLIPQGTQDVGQFIYGSNYNNFGFSLLDSDSTPYYFSDISFQQSFEVTNLIASDKQIYKTKNFGDSIYADSAYTSEGYYAVDNDPSKANFVYPSGTKINDGLFTKVANNRFEFNFEDNQIEENHLYDYNYLRLDTRDIPKSFIQDGNLKIRVSLEGYTGDPSKITKSQLILRQLQAIVFSDKNNLNSQSWDFYGNGYTKSINNEGLILNSGTITLNDNSNPAKTDITSNKIYRASTRIKKTDNTIFFSIGNSNVYAYNPTHPNTPSLKSGINSIEFTLDSNNQWKFYVNGEDGTGTAVGQFDPSIFDTGQITDLYLSIAVEQNCEIEIIELKNQVFNKVNYSDPSGWETDFSDTDSLSNVGAGGETHNNLTYSDISLNREIIYSFNDGIGDIDNTFEDLRLWSDLEFSTNYNSLTQEQYDPDFRLYNWNPVSNPSNGFRWPGLVFDGPKSLLYKNPSSSSKNWEQLTYYDDDQYVGAIRNQPFFDELALTLDNFPIFGVDNIYISDLALDYDLRSYISQFNILSSLQIEVDFTNGAKAVYDWSDVPMTPGQFKYYDNIDSLSTYRFDYPNGVQYGDFGSGWTYTEGLVVDKVRVIHIDESSGHRVEIDKFNLRPTYTDEPNTFEDYLLSQKFDAPNNELLEFSVTKSDFTPELIDDSGSFSTAGSSLSSLVPESSKLSDYIIQDAFGQNTMSFNIKANIYGPNFADGLNSLFANNIVKDFTIIPKLNDKEGNGLKDTSYQYEDSWWHEQELVLANPFNLTFSNIAQNDVSSLADIVFKINMSVDVTNFDTWSFRPNMKIYDYINDKWLTYEGIIQAYNYNNDKVVWDGTEASAGDDGYDSLQSRHDSDYYFQHTDSNDITDNVTIIFKLSNDKYDFSDLVQFWGGNALITLAGLVYVIPGTFSSDWDVSSYENNFDTKGRMSISSTLSDIYSYARAFRKTDIIKKNVDLSNEVANEFDKPQNLGQPWINLDGQLGSIEMQDIARIVDVFGIKNSPKIISVLTDPTPENPIGLDFWRFNRTEGRLYLPLEAILNYDKFNFTMDLWTDFTQDESNWNKFYPDNSFNNITIIENVVRQTGADAFEYFTKNFEVDSSYYVDEPYFVFYDDADGSIDYIEFTDKQNIGEGDSIRGVVHYIDSYRSSTFEDKTNFLKYNTLKFPFALGNLDDSIFLGLNLIINVSVGFVGKESITNILLSESYYDINLDLYKRQSGQSDQFIGTIHLEDQTEIFSRFETYNLKIDLKRSGIPLESLFECFETGKELIINITARFNGVHQGKRLGGRFALEVLSAAMDADLVSERPSIDMVELEPSQQGIQYINMTQDFLHNPAYADIVALYGYKDGQLTSINPNDYTYGNLKSLSSYNLSGQAGSHTGDLSFITETDATYLTLTSDLNYGLDYLIGGQFVPRQPTDFTFEKGSSDFAGDFNSNDIIYSTFTADDSYHTFYPNSQSSQASQYISSTTRIYGFVDPSYNDLTTTYSDDPN
ncbi:hypothetical protein LCGC14_1322330, partial [marine sediment metagenome]